MDAVGRVFKSVDAAKAQSPVSHSNAHRVPEPGNELSTTGTNPTADKAESSRDATDQRGDDTEDREDESDHKVKRPEDEPTAVSETSRR